MSAGRALWFCVAVSLASLVLARNDLMPEIRTSAHKLTEGKDEKGFLDDVKGVRKDVKEAARLHRLAANQGNTDAQLFLGGMYLRGEGVRQDGIEAARSWVR